MQTAKVRVRRLHPVLEANDRRVIMRPFRFGDPHRMRSIIDRIMRLERGQVAKLLSQAFEDFEHRHRDVRGTFRRHFDEVAHLLDPEHQVSMDRALLIGAYFSLEYAIQSAALFNPSMVPHPDQSGAGPGQLRFLMSLRSTGEGHVSSIVFREGMLDGGCNIALEAPPRYAFNAPPLRRSHVEKRILIQRLLRHGAPESEVFRVCATMPERVALTLLREMDGAWTDDSRGPLSPALQGALHRCLTILNADYELEYPADCQPGEIVIFPGTEAESRGMEDLRLTRLVDEDGATLYVGTYTAYDGAAIMQMMLTTEDFRHFRVRPLRGRCVRNKGMALFPRRIDGQYLMVSRHDGENLFILRSGDLLQWEASQTLAVPREPWEMIQIGNCGAPLETEAGWLLLTHGVGPVRRYAIGCMLLDRHQPDRVLGRLRLPLMSPMPAEREGYVPNVLYSCGAVIHRGNLVIPYAMSDSATSFATVAVDELVRELLRSGC